MFLLQIVWVTERILAALLRPELNLQAQYLYNLPQGQNLREV